MPIYPDYKYNAFVMYLALCKAEEEPKWGIDPVFVCYSENIAQKSKNKSTLVSSRALRQSFKNSASKFELGEDQTFLMRNGKQVLKEDEYDKVLQQLHDEDEHPGMLLLRSKIFSQYADVCYDKIDNYVRNCQVCSMNKKETPSTAKKERKPRAKRASAKDRVLKPNKKSIKKAAASPLLCYPLRLHPGAEIKSTLNKFVEVNQLEAAFVLSCVGSVRKCKLRLADSVTMLDIFTNHEIVSLTGTLSAGGHLHASLADEFGVVVGGHVMGNMEVFTTAEIVIGNMPSFRFRRTMDKNTSFKELAIDNADVVPSSTTT